MKKSEMQIKIGSGEMKKSLEDFEAMFRMTPNIVSFETALKFVNEFRKKMNEPELTMDDFKSRFIRQVQVKNQEQLNQ